MRQGTAVWEKAFWGEAASSWCFLSKRPDTSELGRRRCARGSVTEAGNGHVKDRPAVPQSTNWALLSPQPAFN